MRTWFAHSPTVRPVRGGLIIDLQLGLSKAGFPVSVDGIFANQSKLALSGWQSSKGLESSGAVDERAWKDLTGTDAPPLFLRCLALTAAFEGHGYTLAIGNFDGAFITWGIIGFTLKFGSLGEVINRVQTSSPGLVQSVIGAPKASELLAVISESRANQEIFADGISVGQNKVSLRADWKDAFEALGNQSEVRKIQEQVAKDIYWSHAIRDLRDFGQMTELDAALFFDTSVNNGGVNVSKADAIRTALGPNPSFSSAERLKRIAAAIASNSRPEFQADVLSRRETIALGTGAVHGANYSLANWGLAEFAITPADLKS